MKSHAADNSTLLWATVQNQHGFWLGDFEMLFRNYSCFINSSICIILVLSMVEFSLGYKIFFNKCNDYYIIMIMACQSSEFSFSFITKVRRVLLF